MKPTEEQIRRFWEWVDDRIIDWSDENTAILLHKDNRYSVEDYTIDLNNLFKYVLIPMLNKEDKGDYYKLLNIWHESLLLHYEPFDPAIALFWAIYKAVGLGEITK